jgi:serine/threonine-protein kinase
LQVDGQQQAQSVGRYQLVERLAVGGMAEVFLAAERGGELGLGLDRLVVVKRILPHLADQPTFVDMFLREARIVARIRHPNVVQIFELGSSGGFPFIAMEYVAGSTLKQLVSAARRNDTRLPIGAVLHLLSQACAGAHAAHELRDQQGQLYGLVHRDISPHNLMVDDHGHVKLLDFGIAKADGMEQTRTGMLKGKISYMSPEQCRQDKVDRRSDVFALGVVAWELLVGEKPFRGNSELATMQAIVTGDVAPVHEMRPDVPRALSDAIAKALSLERDDRQATAEIFREELREAVRGTPLSPDSDAAARLVRTLLGDRHTRRQRAVEQAMERTLVSLSGVMPLATDVPVHEGSAPSSLSYSEPATRAAATAGVVASLGAVLGLGGLAVAAIGGGIALWALWPDTSPAEVVEERVVPSGEPVVVSVAPVLSPEELRLEHEPIRIYLEDVLQRPVDFQIAPSYELAARKVNQGQVPFAFLPQNTTREAHDDNPDLRLVAIKVVDGSASTDGYLLVAREGDIRTVDDIDGGVICYSDPLSNTGYKLPRAWLAEQGIDPDALTPRFSGNHHQVLLDLIEGKCDVGGTHSGNYNTAGSREVPIAQLRILAITGSTPHDAMVAGPGADDGLVKAMSDALLAFDPMEHAGVDRVGDSERITGFAAPPDDYYD